MPPAVRACLFDMDGLLIDSEDLYTICTNEVLHEYGKPNLPWSVKAQLQGRPGPEAGRIFTEWAQLPCSHEEFMAKMVALQHKYFPSTKPLPGAVSLLQTLSRTGFPIALATSSHARNFQLKTTHLQDIFAVFPRDRKVLGDDPRVAPGRGKPAPDIYLLALEMINEHIRKEGREAEILPEECLVLEDSVPGVEAGRRAGCQVVWCPHPGLLQEYAGKEEEVLAGLTGAHKENGIRHDVKSSARRVPGDAGELNDGYGVLLKTLEDFPYERFGIKI